MKRMIIIVPRREVEERLVEYTSQGSNFELSIDNCFAYYGTEKLKGVFLSNH